MCIHRCHQTIASFRTVVWSAWILIFTGCYDTYREEPVGILVVPFEIVYNGSGCDAAGVVQVLAVLDEGEYQIETDCTRYEAILENIPEGPHSLALYGLNAAGVTVVDNLAEGLETVDIVAFTETTTASPLVLRESPVILQARWDLDWGSCASRGIEYFEAKVFDTNGKEILKSLISCSTPGSGIGEFRTMPDPKRTLVNPSIERIEVQPLKNKTKPLGDSYRLVFDKLTVPGPGEAISLSFKCLEDGCYLPGNGCGLPQ